MAITGSPAAKWPTGCDGAAEWYRNRYILADHVAEALGRPHMPGSRGEVGDGNANTSIIGHAGQTLALIEGSGPPVHSPTSSNRSRRPTSTARSKAPSPPTRSDIPAPANSTP